MDRLTSMPRSRCVIIHSNRLVAEDLRQLLLAEGADEVLIASSTADVSPALDAVAFVEGAITKVGQDQVVLDWLALRTPVIAMNGAHAGDGGRRGLHVLEQPFRTDDVTTLIRDLQVFRRASEQSPPAAG